MKAIAPSAVLRKWFNHDVGKWNDFKNRYNTELLHSHAVQQVLELKKKQKTLTLVYSAKDEQHNQAIVIKEFLEKF